MESNYQVKYGFNNMDFDKVTALLSTAYWSEGIKIEEIKQGASNSALVVGVFLNNEQIGYARTVSDKTRFAYIMDVFVEEKHRKKGIGKLLVNSLLEHKDLKDVYRWVLITKDAHELYKKVGFKPVNNPEEWMEINKGRPNTQNS